MALPTLSQIRKLPLHEQAKFLDLLKELEEAERIEKARYSFMDYVKYMWPGFINGRHHEIMAEKFDRIVSGDLKRLIINMPPRHTKSEFASRLLPSYYLGHYPDRKIIQASHTGELATNFGRQVRNLVRGDRYRNLFPDTNLTADSKAAGRWNTSEDGIYFAIGVGGSLAGWGADLLIVDDPHSEQDYLQALGGDTSVFDKAYEWFTSGPRQRLQPGAAVVIVMTRWHLRDITGRIVKSMTSQQGREQWEIIEFPALFPETDNPLWPEFWSKDELVALRDELPSLQWKAQYMQQPSSEEGALVKRDWWKIWNKKNPPPCEFIIQSWDTAFTTKTTNDYSACTTWGVFYLPDDNGIQKANLILLDAYRARIEFPTLKRTALEMYQETKPDALIVEAKASGLPLIHELRQIGIPVSEYTPHRGTGDKVARVNAVSDLFASGIVWCPDTRWAEEVRDEIAAFPQGEHDDYVDSAVQALLRFRQGGFIRLDSDEDDDEFIPRRADYY